MSQKSINNKKYYLKNIEKIKARSKIYRKKNKDKIKEKNKIYYNINKKLISEYHKKYYQENICYIKDRDKKYRIKNKEIIKKYKINYRLNPKNKDKIYKTIHKWHVRNRKIINEKRNKRYKTDINFRLELSLRNRLNKIICRQQRGGSAIRDLGCSIEEFKKYIESKFTEGMCWDNYGNKKDCVCWHLDHIKPISKFDLTNREEFLLACHYTNIQPLWAVDNIKKSNK